jgi:hypothetical protein
LPRQHRHHHEGGVASTRNWWARDRDLVCNASYAGLVVDNHQRVEPSNLRLRAVELFHSRLPFTVVDGVGGGARFPQIDAARAATVLAAQIIFAYEPLQSLVFRRGRLKGARCLLQTDMCYTAAEAFERKDLAAVREIGDYIVTLLAQLLVNRDLPADTVKPVDDKIVAIVISRCRKSPNVRLEIQTRLVGADWRDKPGFWDELRGE